AGPRTDAVIPHAPFRLKRCGGRKEMLPPPPQIAAGRGRTTALPRARAQGRIARRLADDHRRHAGTARGLAIRVRAIIGADGTQPPPGRATRTLETSSAAPMTTITP